MTNRSTAGRRRLLLGATIVLLVAGTVAITSAVMLTLR